MPMAAAARRLSFPFLFANARALTAFVPPDVATVTARQRYLSPGEESAGAPLWVVSKQADGRWLLTACQNTGVVADQP